MLPDETIQLIRQKTNLPTLIAHYVPLKKHRGRLVGLCPFHQEKTPSFGIAKDKQSYYCFGCQASGDAVSFLRHVEGLGYREAVEWLAERAGIELPPPDGLVASMIAKARANHIEMATKCISGQRAGDVLAQLEKKMSGPAFTKLLRLLTDLEIEREGEEEDR